MVGPYKNFYKTKVSKKVPPWEIGRFFHFRGSRFAKTHSIFKRKAVKFWYLRFIGKWKYIKFIKYI